MRFLLIFHQFATRLPTLMTDQLLSISLAGQGQYGGGYGSYVIIPEVQLCVKLPTGVPPEIGCMLSCSALTAYNAVLKVKSSLESAVRIRGMSNLLVVGCGGLGAWVIVIIKNLLCNRTIRVICADVSKEKLDSAEKLGADDVILWNTADSAETLVDATTVSGYNKIDAVIDFVGNAKTVDTSIRCLHKGGTIALVGLLDGGEYSVSLPMLVSNSISIQGVRTATHQVFKELVDLLAVQQIQTYPPVEIVQLHDINAVLDRLRAGKVKGRAVIKHSDV